MLIVLKWYIIENCFVGNLQVKVGVQGAEECGDYEEWFNYRLSRAAPETCAEFLGSFVADQTNSQFVKGGKWLVWKFEVLFLPYSTSLHYMILGMVLINMEDICNAGKIIIEVLVLGVKFHPVLPLKIGMAMDEIFNRRTSLIFDLCKWTKFNITPSIRAFIVLLPYNVQFYGLDMIDLTG